MNEPHEHWMRIALEEAEIAATNGDIPVGAVAVKDGRIIARGHNCKEQKGDPTAHAEIVVLRAAAQALDDWRLDGVTLYCTLEPCAMCAGAMVHARLERLVWAADDPKAGAGGSVMNLLQHEALNHHVEVLRGVLAEDAAEQLRDFFAMLRGLGRK